MKEDIRQNVEGPEVNNFRFHIMAVNHWLEMDIDSSGKLWLV